MKLRNLYIYITSFFMSALLFIGCDDEPLVDVPELGEGSATLSATVSFFPHSEVLGSRSTKGDAIKDIESLSVIVYDQYKALYKIYNSNNNVKDFTYTQVTHSDNPTMSPDDTSHKAQWSKEESARATFTLPETLPFGKYYIYCVANMGSITEEQAEDLEKLKKMELTWNKTNIAANNQMFGYFTLSSKSSKDTPLAGFDADPIFVSKATLDENGKVPVHAWIKRAASKVTVAYDPSGLKENVFIYIRKVTIKDIPVKCLLGADNKPVLGEDKDKSKVLNEDGESIYYNTEGEVEADAGEDYESWLKLSSGVDPQGSKHTPTDNALFFYENMQGDYEGKTEYNKVPQKSDVQDCINGDYKHPSNYDTKDQVPMGSYIEVEGFYVSRNTENVGSGPIKYRFMLGKNTTYNFNAQRNHHYKLTLKFNGWANQPEWHIDYQEENPEMYIPDVFYMPYLYNQKAMFPIKLNGDCVELRAKIIENNWAPCYADGTNPTEPWPATAPDDDYHAFRWNKKAYATYNGKNSPYLGFLALTKPNDSPPANLFPNITFSAKTAGLNCLKAYYEGNGADGVVTNKIPQNGLLIDDFQDGENKRPKELDGIEIAPDINNYIVNVIGGTKNVLVPFFTRPKTMIATSGYSGNNPYGYFNRLAVVEFTAKFKDATSETGYTEKKKEVRVLQVPRITNPKAVWRRAGSGESFNVTLTTRKSPRSDSNYEPFRSDGSWRAMIETGDKENFSLSVNDSNEERDMIIGKTGSFVQFTINFKGQANKFAIVTIWYNGETCVHKIFLRQGYDPVNVIDGGPKWCSYNVYSAVGELDVTSKTDENRVVDATLVRSPLSIGSLFKKGNYSQGIKASNNDTWGPLVDLDGNLQLTNGTSVAWANIKYLDSRNIYDNKGNLTEQLNIDWKWAKFATADGTKYRLPTWQEFYNLTEDVRNSDYGFGILYGDGTEDTQTDYAKAEGFSDPDGDLEESKNGEGVRGIIVYNPQDARQIFFTMGKYGQGRRTQFIPSPNKNGVLRYGDVSRVLSIERNSNNIYRPIPYNLPHTPGAIYWINEWVPEGHVEGTDKFPCTAWDMNYFSFDFGPYTQNCWADALPIKLVLDE